MNARLCTRAPSPPIRPCRRLPPAPLILLVAASMGAAQDPGLAASGTEHHPAADTLRTGSTGWSPGPAATGERVPPPPEDPGLRRGSLVIGQVERTFLHYAPPDLPPQPPAVLVFHGAGGDGDQMRHLVGQELERLARQSGFVVVYANGHEGHWNDCRAGVPYPAKERGIDDLAFVRGLIHWLGHRYGVDPRRIRAIGFSNGAHLAYRLALELPGELQAIAAFGAGLPVEEELDCRESGAAIPVMVVNGTMDRINPYDGGDAVGPDGRFLGRVRSTPGTAKYFARLAGHGGEPVREEVLPAAEAQGTAVRRTEWSRLGAPVVVLVTIVGGGHTIPGPGGPFPEFLGAVETRFRAMEEAVRFFDRLPVSRDRSTALVKCPPSVSSGHLLLKYGVRRPTRPGCHASDTAPAPPGHPVPLPLDPETRTVSRRATS
jgi:polyhydroxybutyrate depolymerase